jgi:hypothetical protein
LGFSSEESFVWGHEIFDILMVALDGCKCFQESDFRFWKFGWHEIYSVSSAYSFFSTTSDFEGRRQRMRSMFWPRFGGVGTRLRLLSSLGDNFKIRFLYVMTYLGEGLFLTLMTQVMSYVGSELNRESNFCHLCFYLCGPFCCFWIFRG